MSTTLCQIGLALPAHALWRATAAARAALARGDIETARDRVAMIAQIERHARVPSLRRACLSARASIGADYCRTRTNPTTQGAAS